MLIDLANIIGLIGSLLLIVAYFLLLSKKFKSDDYKFLFMNLFGAIFLFINGIMINAPFFYPLINMVWIVGTIFQIGKRRK